MLEFLLTVSMFSRARASEIDAAAVFLPVAVARWIKARFAAAYLARRLLARRHVLRHGLGLGGRRRGRFGFGRFGIGHESVAARNVKSSGAAQQPKTTIRATMLE